MKERERESVCERESERERVCVGVCVCSKRKCTSLGGFNPIRPIIASHLQLCQVVEDADVDRAQRVVGQLDVL